MLATWEHLVRKGTLFIWCHGNAIEATTLEGTSANNQIDETANDIPMVRYAHN